MILRLFPLVEEHHDEQRRHDKLDALGVEMQHQAEQGAERRAAHPVDLVEQRYKEHKPPAVDALRRRDGAVDGKRLVAHAVDQVQPLPAEPLILLQHGDAVKQVARVDADRYEALFVALARHARALADPGL